MNEIIIKLINITKRTYGRKFRYIKSVVDSVIKPAALYLSEVWRTRTLVVGNNKTLLAAHKPF